MKKEFNLSDEVMETEKAGKVVDTYLAEDIKEFIKKLKEECNKFECYDFKENIDKLAGENLI